MEFSERLIKSRKAKGLSQEALAEELNLSRQAISKWETGESKPDLDNLIALCKVLEIGVDYLCYGTEPNVSVQKRGEKSLYVKKLVIAVCLIAVFGVLTFLCGVWFGSRTAVIDTDRTVVATDRDEEAILRTLEIVDVDIVKEEEQLLRILPSVVPEDLQMELLIVNANNPETINRICEKEDIRFLAKLDDLNSGYTYRISVVLTLGTAQKVVPLLQLKLDRKNNTFLYEELWR